MELQPRQISPEDVYAVAVERAKVSLPAQLACELTQSRRMVDTAVAEGRVVYGITTGFGRFADVVIAAEEMRALQRNLLRSHAVGVGPRLAEETVRAIMLLRASSLALGHSGVRPVVVERLIECLNRGVHPVIPSQGSLGASGDLAPLAHMALVLIGEGQAVWQGEVLPGAEALHRAGLSPIQLEAKEGLALINGTQVMSALAALSLVRAEWLANAADAAGALTMEALRGIPAAFAAELQAVRPHPGQVAVAARLRGLLEGSRLLTQPGELRVQDAYALRCMPQVHGASRQVLAHVRQVLELEIRSATDNPLLFPESQNIISGGNFHGQPIALALDYLALGLAEWGSISERRTARLVDPALSGLPAFLTAQGGLHSGLMIAHYTAAALAAENKLLASPASADSIPTSANQEDHVSMGQLAARKAARAVDNLAHMLAIELICAAQGVDFLDPSHLGRGTGAIYRFVRERVPHIANDRSLTAEIEALATDLRAGALDACLRMTNPPLE